MGVESAALSKYFRTPLSIYRYNERNEKSICMLKPNSPVEQIQRVQVLTNNVVELLWNKISSTCIILVSGCSIIINVNIYVEKSFSIDVEH